MTKTNKLKAKMTYLNLTIRDIAESLGISYYQTHKKINNRVFFTQRELEILKKLLRLTDTEFVDMFF